MVTQRLNRQDWLDVAIMSLAHDGHEALRAERLAKRLGVSRGSFYWHFPDVRAFEQAVLDEWERVAVDLPYSEATAVESGDPSTALRDLIGRVFRSPVALERAVRSWAATSAPVAERLSKVDQRRISMLTGLIPTADASLEFKRTQAIILYWSYLGHVTTTEIEVDSSILSALIKQFCRGLTG